MAVGKAVVVTRTSGQTDVVEDGVTGLTVPVGDSDAWVEALTRLRDDHRLREALGANAREWVLRHASLDHWSQQVAKALRGDLPRRALVGNSGDQADPVGAAVRATPGEE